MAEEDKEKSSKNEKSNQKKPIHDHYFQKGNKLGKGRKEGSKNKASIMAKELLSDDLNKLIRVVIDRALDGDMTAMKLCLERLISPVKGNHSYLNLRKIETMQDIKDVTSDVIEKMSDGEITAEEAHTITTVIDSQRKNIEMIDLERRVTQLERGSS